MDVFSFVTLYLDSRQTCYSSVRRPPRRSSSRLFVALSYSSSLGVSSLQEHAQAKRALHLLVVHLEVDPPRRSVLRRRSCPRVVVRVVGD